jgi:hypothetical protein
MRVTAAGHDLIYTGEIDKAVRRPGRFAEGDEFDCPSENVDIYEKRRMATRVPPMIAPASAGLRAVPDQRQHAPCVIDHEAIARLAARSVRDDKTGCLVWQGSKVNGGYGQITYRRELLRTHRLAWVAHNGAVASGHYVCHACDNPSCVAIEHLFVGTPQENYRDMRRKGRLKYNAKLAAGQVSEIKRRFARGESAVAIARDYAVSYDQILAIKNGRAWRDTEEEHLGSE